MTLERRRRLTRGPDGRLNGSVWVRRRLSKKEVCYVERQIVAGRFRYEIADELGIGVRRLYDLIREQLPGVGRGRPGIRLGTKRRPPDDFPVLSIEEIYRRAAEIRKTWTPQREADAWNPNFGGPIE